MLYGSKTIVSWETSTKVPLIKYTPVLTPKADPVAVASSGTKLKTVSPAVNVVFP